MRGLLAILALLPAAAPITAWADTHALGIRNGSGEAVTGIYMSPPGSGSPGTNRLLSHLPPGAQGTISYSAGCRADVRIAYAGGHSEDHADVDVCGGNKLVAGQDGTAGPAMPAVATKAASGKPITKAGAATATVVKAPPPVVPPWTGKSITKRFGGME